jgi:hypothetical protein
VSPRAAGNPVEVALGLPPFHLTPAMIVLALHELDQFQSVQNFMRSLPAAAAAAASAAAREPVAAKRQRLTPGSRSSTRISSPSPALARAEEEDAAEQLLDRHPALTGFPAVWCCHARMHARMAVHYACEVPPPSQGTLQSMYGHS